MAEKALSRKANWCSNEREVLVAEVSRRDKVLFAKIQGPITAASKEKSWGEVARLVSAVGVGRSADEAKKKWSSMKSDTKQKASACRRDQQATGWPGNGAAVDSGRREDFERDGGGLRQRSSRRDRHLRHRSIRFDHYLSFIWVRSRSYLCV